MENVLVTSLSGKVPLVKAIRNALERCNREAEILGADANTQCVGRYFVDHFWQMPTLETLTFQTLLAYCKEHRIQAIIPTRDGELLFFSSLRKALSHEGVHVMVSQKESITTALDKLKFYQFLQSRGIQAIPTATDIDALDCLTYVVKEQTGAGSRNIGLNLNKTAAIKHAKQLEHPIFQPFIHGEEISVDLYLDLSGKARGVILRKRELVIGGESQITSTFRDHALESLCVLLAEAFQFTGHIMFQLIQSKNGTFYFLECNPRFGGASTLSLAAGLDSFHWFFQEISGENLEPFKRAQEEKRLVRFPEDLIL